MVTVNAGMSKFSGVVQADTVIANSVVGTSYTPGRREHVVGARCTTDRPGRPRPPLWRDGLAGTVELDRPAHPALRHATTSSSGSRPSSTTRSADVGAFALRHETWREPAAGLVGPRPQPRCPAVPADPRPLLPVAGGTGVRAVRLARQGDPPHAATSPCSRASSPGAHRDRRAVDPAKRATYREFGWVPRGAGRRLGRRHGGLVDGEERLPLFPMTYVDGHRRRVLAAMVPVAARERYEARPAAGPDPTPTTRRPSSRSPVARGWRPSCSSLEAVLGLAAKRPGDRTEEDAAAPPPRVDVLRHGRPGRRSSRTSSPDVWQEKSTRHGNGQGARPCCLRSRSSGRRSGSMR